MSDAKSSDPQKQETAKNETKAESFSEIGDGGKNERAKVDEIGDYKFRRVG